MPTSSAQDSVLGIADSIASARSVEDRPHDERRHPAVQLVPRTIHWTMDSLPDRYFTVISILSTLFAYSAGNWLIQKSVLHSTFAFLGKSGVPARDEWFGVAALSWLVLALILEIRGTGAGKTLLAYLVTETVFLLVLAGLRFAGRLTVTQTEFFVTGSLLYLPFSVLIGWVGGTIIRSAQLIREDARILLVGCNEEAKQAIEHIRNASTKAEIIGCLDPDPSSVGTVVAGIKVLGPVTMGLELLFGGSVDLLLFATSPDLVPNAKTVIDAALEIGIPVSVVLDSGLQRLGYRIEHPFAKAPQIAALATTTLSTIYSNRTYLLLKRLCDVAISGVLLVLLAPLFLLLALLVKITSPNGPVFYHWRVLGQHRRPFVGYKFRTMVPNADQLKDQLMKRNEMTGPVFKMRNDPRITTFGKFLRKYSIDELPQLYSVLKGDMSLVGPRPPSRQEADQFEFWQRRKLSVKPGITCLWQVNGRSAIKSFDEWARLDLEYIERASVAFDFAILLRTIPVVILGSGAH